MTNHFSTLIEKALTSDSDPERIACLNHAAKSTAEKALQ
jgi:hypothetical protein